MKKFLLLLLVFVTSTANATRNEDYFTKQWCYQMNPLGEVGKVQVRMGDGSWADCITQDYAIEFDWGNKFKEGIGQSLNYSYETGKRPGVVLLLKKESDEKHWRQMQNIILKFNLPIQTWKVRTWLMP